MPTVVLIISELPQNGREARLDKGVCTGLTNRMGEDSLAFNRSRKGIVGNGPLYQSLNH